MVDEALSGSPSERWSTPVQDLAHRRAHEEEDKPS
jgi:hypothetical protein